MKEETKENHKSEREKLIKRIRSSYSLPQEEYLTILLNNALPNHQKNEELAKRLIEHYHTIENLCSASISELTASSELDATTAAYLKIIGIYQKAFQKKLEVPSYEDEKKFREFLRARYWGEKFEILDIYFLGKKNEVLSRKSFSIQSADSIQIDPMEFARAVTDSGASKIVVTHNHPGSRCRPSEEDERFTKQTQMFCSIANVELLDHLIIGYDGVFSFRDSLKLQEIKDRFSVKNVLDE